MAEIDKERCSLGRFNTVTVLKALKVPIAQVSFHLTNLKDFLLNKQGVSNVQQADSPTTRAILLNTTEEFPEKLLTVLKDPKCAVFDYSLSLDYSSYSPGEVLRQLVPKFPILAEPLNIQSVACIFLPVEMKEFRDLIGQVLLDKTQQLTVVGVFGGEAEVLAGAPHTLLTVSENDLNFTYDFLSDPIGVFLANERTRLLGNIPKNSVICDCSPGVGQFALRAAKLGHRIFVCTESVAQYNAIVSNAKSNKLHKLVHVFKKSPFELLSELRDTHTEDIEDMLTQDEFYLLENPLVSKLPITMFEHLIMKIQCFEDSAQLHGFYKGKQVKLPVIHFYAETKAPAPKEELINNIKKAWVHKLKDSKIKEFRLVRDQLYYIHLELPEEVAFSQEEILVSSGDEEPEEDLVASMRKDLDFMLHSVRENQFMQTSALVSNMSSIVISNSLKRALEDPSENSKKLRKDNN